MRKEWTRTHQSGPCDFRYGQIPLSAPPFGGRREREMVAHGQEFISKALYVKGKLSELKVVLRMSVEGTRAFH